MRLQYETLAIYRSEVTGEYGPVDDWLDDLRDCAIVVNCLGAAYAAADLTETVIPNFSHEAVKRYDIETNRACPLDACAVAARTVASEHLAGGCLIGVTAPGPDSGTGLIILECGPADALADVDDATVRRALAENLGEVYGGGLP